jgi:uncharacterized phage protein (TIGR02220 family)
MIDWFVDHATWEDEKEVYMPDYGMVKLKRGEVIFGSIKFAKFLGTTRQKLRSRLKILQTIEFLTIQTTSRFSIATLLNYSKYQDIRKEKNQQKNHQLTINQPSVNHQLTTTNTYKTLSKELIIHLNKISGRNFTPKANIDYVIPRLKDGYTVEQCKSVIEKKWLDEDFNKKYFCPETLFRKSKFEKYLNEDIGVGKCGNPTGKLQTTDEIELAKWEQVKTK